MCRDLCPGQVRCLVSLLPICSHNTPMGLGAESIHTNLLYQNVLPPGEGRQSTDESTG